VLYRFLGGHDGLDEFMGHEYGTPPQDCVLSGADEEFFFALSFWNR